MEKFRIFRTILWISLRDNYEIVGSTAASPQHTADMAPAEHATSVLLCCCTASHCSTAIVVVVPRHPTNTPTTPNDSTKLIPYLTVLRYSISLLLDPGARTRACTKGVQVLTCSVQSLFTPKREVTGESPKVQSCTVVYSKIRQMTRALHIVNRF